MGNPTDAARLLAALRKSRRGGRPKVLRPCPICGKMLGAVEMRKHIPNHRRPDPQVDQRKWHCLSCQRNFSIRGGHITDCPRCESTRIRRFWKAGYTEDPS